MRYLYLILIYAVLFLGCGDKHCSKENPNPYPPPGNQAPHVAVITTGGIALYYPIWLDKRKEGTDWKNKLFDEIHLTPPETDVRIPVGTKGAPAGTMVVVLDPGAYYAAYSSTFLARGEHRRPDQNRNFHLIYVSWKDALYDSNSVIPAYAHELRHLYTGDPNAGH